MMRLELPRLVAGTVPPGLSFEVGPLVPRTAFVLERELRRGLPAEVALELEPTVRLRTATGWPIHVHPARVLADGVLREVRLLACYEITIYAAAVHVTARDAARYQDLSQLIRDVLESARPMLTVDEPACISELWEM